MLARLQRGAGGVIPPSTPFLLNTAGTMTYQANIESLGLGDIGTGQPGTLRKQSKRETLPEMMWVISPTEGLRATVEPLTTRGPAAAYRKGAGVQGRTGAPGTVRRKLCGSLDSSSV